MAVVFHYIPSTDEYELTGAAVSPLHLRNRGEILLGPNPPYPVAKPGDFWTCRQQGRIGGSSGKLLGVGDAIVALYASTGGLEGVAGLLWLRLSNIPVSLESNSEGSSSITFPVNTTAPVLTGTGVEGDALSTTTGVWDNSPTSYAYQWVRNNVDITGETGGMYTPVNGDVGTTIYVRVTATNGDGSDSANSNSIVITDIAAGAPANTVAPAITGTTVEGDTLSCSTGTWTNSPASYAYQWQRDVADIGGATATAYVIAGADVGTSIRCRVTATNAFGSASANSNAVTPTSVVDAESRYWGSTSNAGPLSNGAVIALSTDTALVKAKTVTISLSNTYAYYAYPAAFGTLTALYVDGDTTINQIGGMILTVQSVTPSGGAATSYNIYRSEFTLSGSIQFAFS